MGALCHSTCPTGQYAYNVELGRLKTEQSDTAFNYEFFDVECCTTEDSRVDQE